MDKQVKDNKTELSNEEAAERLAREEELTLKFKEYGKRYRASRQRLKDMMAREKAEKDMMAKEKAEKNKA